MAADIVLAGHGSGKPSTKSMNSYCASRQEQDRGLVEVRRFLNLSLVTFLEIVLLLNGYNPKGVEYPGIFGDSCMDVLRLYQEKNNLVVDGVVGILTFSSLINGIT